MLRFPAILLFVFATTPLLGQLPDGIVDTQNPAEQPPSPAESLAKISVADGFHISLFAGEPDVAQPIAINFDDRGRLWVAESFSYIEWKRNGRDRILIFEDTNKDGRFDKRTVFWDQGNHVSGFQIGYGGVWICDAPNLLFIPDADRDDIPDAEPGVILDGWTTEAEHNFFNGLTWGPDGWLYGRHGIKKPSLVGKPGTPEDERIALSCSIWRYHPVREIFEVYAEGTINPWGLDWNEEGQAFITTSVVDHLWHLVPGARFARWEGHGTAVHPHSYDLMEPASDHRHWRGGQTERKQQGVHDEEGGGHSHCGLMIYQSDSWPVEYRGRAFFSNVLGQRINTDHLTRKNSGYVASHGEDFLRGGSDWFRATDLKQGAYGEMMTAEWTDFGECHDRDGIHRSSGRIYRIGYGKNPGPEPFDVADMTTEELLGLLNHENVWWRRHALRNLYERFGENAEISGEQKAHLLEVAESGSVRDAVTAVQALHALSSDHDWVSQVFERNKGEGREAIRAQVIGLEFADGVIPMAEKVDWLEGKIENENSPLVHLWMIAALQRIPIELRWEAAERLASIRISTDDRNLILMRWYGLEPLVESDPDRAMKLALAEGHPYLSRSIARRVVAAESTTAALRALQQNPSSPAVTPILEGMLASLPSRVETPSEWAALSPLLRGHKEEAVQRNAFRLAHRFGDSDAEEEMVAIVRDSTAPSDERIELIRLLVSSRSEKMEPHIGQLLRDSKIGVEAIRAVAVFPESDSASRLIRMLDEEKLTPRSEAAILETLASRVDFADALVDAFLDGKIKGARIPAYLARQIAMISSKGTVFAKNWGLNPADAKKKEKLIAIWKKRLPEKTLDRADPKEGKQVFQRVCSACHQLYGEGGIVGPDLTGSNRANLDYFLINVLFPSEDVSPDYQLVTLTLKDGRVLSGSVKEETEKVITFSQVDQVQRIDVADIASRQVLDVSLMPQGLLDVLSREDVRDLVGYLRTTEPLP